MFQRPSSIFSSSDRSFSIVKLVLLLVLTIGFIFFASMIISNLYEDKIKLTKLTATYLDKPAYTFDPDIGYNYLPNSTFRYTSYVSGEVVVDQKLDTNNLGFISDVDYFYKNPKNVYRIMVLGDSFTDAKYVDSNWVENLRAHLSKDDVSKNGKKVEIYSLARAGSGIQNLKRIISKELPKYEFDAVIITGLKISKARFFTGHSMKDYTVMGLIPMATDEDRQFDERIESQLGIKMEHKNVDLINATDTNVISNQSSNVKKKNNLELLRKSRNNLIMALKLLVRPVKIMVKKKFLESKIEEVVSMLLDLEKDLVFVAIPNKDWVELKKENIEIVKRFSLYSKNHKIPFYNCYDDFFGQDKTGEDLFFKHDDHWNQAGINHFSDGLMDYLYEEFFDKN